MLFPIQDFPCFGHCHLRTEHCIGAGRQKPDDAPLLSQAVGSWHRGRVPSSAAIFSRRLSPCSSAARPASAMALVSLGLIPAEVGGPNEAGLYPIQALPAPVVLVTYWTSLVNASFAVSCLLPGLVPSGSCSWLPGILPCCTSLVSVTWALLCLSPGLVPCLLLFSFALSCVGSLASCLYREADSAPYAELGVRTKIFTGELLGFRSHRRRQRFLFLALGCQVPKRLAACQSKGLGPDAALHAAP